MADDPTTPTAPLLPDRIRVARELRGLTQRDVVERMGHTISPPALSQIEAGKIRPSPATAERLAVTLEVPLAFFSAQWPAGGQPLTYFRNLRSTSVRERRRASAQALLLSDFVAALEQHVRIPEIAVPTLQAPRGAAREEIEDIAQQVRNVWNLGHEPVPHVVRSLERHGIVVARLRMGDSTVDAFSIRIGRRPLVLLTDDKSDNYVRSRFDASHELGHLVMHRGVEPGTKEIEQQAHNFAAAFLLPEASARDELPGRLDATDWSRLAEMKSRWGISIAALLFRARALRIISADAYQSAMRYMSFRGWRRQEPGDREMGAPEAPLLLERSVRRAEVEAGLSTEALVRSAHLPLSDMNDLLEAAVDDRPIVEL
ncbi:MAG: XRE family transcriptional regulator [Chloroflexota bacterium]|nr:XRE family transcriptional regulator [Chloroflexota bacterium]